MNSKAIKTIFIIVQWVLLHTCFLPSSYATEKKHTALHPTNITLTITTFNTTCEKYNGKIIVQATGGTAPYTYTISGPFSPQPSGVFYNLPAGTYTITATDATSTTASEVVTLTNTFTSPTAWVTNITKATGCTSNDASFSVGASGGLPPYTYSLDNINYQASNIFTNLTGGGYFYVVKDANGCNCLSPVLFPNLASINTNGSCDITISGGGLGLGCNPENITFDLSGVSGGTPPYYYSMDGINYQTNRLFTNLVYGVYTFWVKDAVGHITLYSISTIDNCPNPFKIMNAVQPAICGQNGTLTITATEGNAPYLYSIDGINYQAGNQFTGLVPGTYTVRVKDSYSLVATKLVSVPNRCTVVAAAVTPASCGNSNGRIQASASSGTPPYQYSSDGINFTTNNTFTNLAAGNYTIYAKDATGATGNTIAVVSNIAGPQITSVDITATGCDGYSGKAVMVVQGGTAPLQYSIDGTNFQNTSLFTNLSQGTYTLTVKDANGCIATKAALVGTSSVYPIVNLGKDTSLCEGKTLLLNAANANSTYLWQDGSATATYLVKQTGQYSVQVTMNGCTSRSAITVTYTLRPRFTLGPDRTICNGETQLIAPAIDPIWKLLWQDGSTNKSFVVNLPGRYTLQATNECGSSQDEVLFTSGLCKIYVPNIFTPNNDGKNDLLQAYGTELVNDFDLKVYNRYGQLIFETRDKNTGWDGKVSNIPQPTGTYPWTLKYQTSQNNKPEVLKGSCILVR